MAIIIITTLAGILAIVQPLLESKHKKAKTWVSAVLVVLLIFSGALQFYQQRKTEKALMGDPDNPPYFDVNDFGENGGQAEGVIINPSDYPAYAVTATMSFLNNLRGTPMPPTKPSDIPPKGRVSIFNMTLVKDDPTSASSIDYEVSILTRNASVLEQFMLRRLANTKWTRALRVVKPRREIIDPDFPRNSKGEVDWPVFLKPGN